METKISSKGWIVIPAPLRRKYRLQAGDRVQIVDYGGALTIVPSLEEPVAQARGMLRGETSLVKALLDERARDLPKE